MFAPCRHLIKVKVFHSLNRGVYRFDYIIEDLRQAKWHQVTAVRLPVNVAIDQATLLCLGGGVWEVMKE